MNLGRAGGTPQASEAPTSSAEERRRAFEAIDAMESAYLAGPSAYHPSRFWESLRQQNHRWLLNDGLEQFKRTVNNNYFNWMVSPQATFARQMLRSFVRRRAKRPSAWWSLGKARLDQDGFFRTFAADQTQLTRVQRRQYAAYLWLLLDHARAHDPGALLETVEEPMLGNPWTITVDGRRRSQDLITSFLERRFMLEGMPQAPRRIIEIGGGYGRLAALSHTLRSASHPTQWILVDIPPALGLAQWYLTTLFPDARAFRFRPFSSWDEVGEELSEADFAFLLPHQLELLPHHHADVVVNISSFQEMTPAQVDRYYDLVDDKARHLYTKQWLFWRNPVDGITVPAVAYPTRSHWALLTSRLDPVHPDFFEALFATSPKPAAR